MVMISAHEDGNALLRAAQWIESLAQGPLVVGIAILAIAAIGFSMLSGRISAWRGLTIVVGCFVVFGAPAIAQGIASAASNVSEEIGPEPPIAIISPEQPFAPPVQSPPPANTDPYAGASISQ